MKKENCPIEVVCTGNELLDGSIVDSNTQRLAKALRPLGLSIQKTAIVPDRAYSISSAVADAKLRARVLIISGGLGPTSDDLTLETVASALGLRMVFSGAAQKNVLRRMKKLGRTKILPGHQRQMMIPEGAEVLPNLEGTAPGIHLKAGCQIFFLPGVPREYDYILKNSLIPFLKKFKTDEGRYLFVVKFFGKSESELNEWVSGLKIPSSIEVGYRYSFPEVHLKFLVRAKSESIAQTSIKPFFAKLRKKYSRNIFSGLEGVEESYEEAMVKYFRQSKIKLAVAESCTGGLITSMLTKVSGSSEVLDRGFVVYSNESKSDLLGVSSDLILRDGAVSESVATQMAIGALRRSKADRAVAVTGIAGPSGGTKKKPVGTIWLAVTDGQKTETRQLQLGWSRDWNQKYSAYMALRMLRWPQWR